MLVLHDTKMTDFARLEDGRLRVAGKQPGAVAGPVLRHSQRDLACRYRDTHRLARRYFRHEFVLYVKVDVACVRGVLVTTDQKLADGVRRRLQRR